MKEPKLKPWQIPIPPLATVHALKALAKSEATKDQQALAFDWLINVTGVKRDQFTPGQSSMTDYLLGRRSIGLAIADIMSLPPPKQGA